MVNRKRIYKGGIHYPSNPLFSEDPTVVSSPIFEEYFGPGKDLLDIRTVNRYDEPMYKYKVPTWTVFLTDLIQQTADAGTGLVDERNDPSEKKWVTSTRMHAIPAIMNPPSEDKKMITIVTGDRHLNPDEWDFDAISRYPIYPEQLHPEELKVAQKSPELRDKIASGELLTIGQYFELMGEVISDQEDFNFIPHARDKMMRYIKSIEGWARWSAEEAKLDHQATGRANPAPYLYLDYKTGLSSISLPNQYGAGGNNYYNLLRGIYRDAYTLGKWHRGHKVLVVGGTAPEYSLRLLLESAVDLDFFVVWQLCWSDTTMGIDSLMNTVDFINSRYGKKVLPTFDWLPTHLFGPKPADWDFYATSMKAEMVLDELGDYNNNSRLYDIYNLMNDEYQDILIKQNDMQVQIDELKLRRRFVEAAALEVQMPRVPFFIERGVRELAEKNSRGGDMFWSMDRIVEYLRSGGE